MRLYNNNKNNKLNFDNFDEGGGDDDNSHRTHTDLISGNKANIKFT